MLQEGAFQRDYGKDDKTLNNIFLSALYIAQRLSEETGTNYRLISGKTYYSECRNHNLFNASWAFIQELATSDGFLDMNPSVEIIDDKLQIKHNEKLPANWNEQGFYSCLQDHGIIPQTDRIYADIKHVFNDIEYKPIMVGNIPKRSKGATIIPAEYPFFIPEGLIVLENLDFIEKKQKRLPKIIRSLIK